jgi:hypothetical protein
MVEKGKTESDIEGELPRRGALRQNTASDPPPVAGSQDQEKVVPLTIYSPNPVPFFQSADSNGVM